MSAKLQQCSAFVALEAGLRLDVEAHVVELATAALAHRLDIRRLQLLGQLLQVRAEAHRAQEAGRIRRGDRIRLEPGLDLREAGALEALGRLLGAGEVPGPMPVPEVLGVWQLGPD